MTSCLHGFRKTHRARQAHHRKARHRRPQARRQAMDRLGRQADRLRRPRPPLRRQVFHRQLPPGLRRQDRAQQAPRHRTLRQDGAGSGAARGPQAARHGRGRRGPGGGAREKQTHSDAQTGLRAVHEGQPKAQGEHQPELPRPFRAASRRLARAVSRHCHARRCGGAVQPHHRAARLGRGQPVHVSAALGLSPALRGLPGAWRTLSISGSRGAAGSIPSRAARSRRRPRFCRAGARGSRRW